MLNSSHQFWDEVEGKKQAKVSVESFSLDDDGVSRRASCSMQALIRSQSYTSLQQHGFSFVSIRPETRGREQASQSAGKLLSYSWVGLQLWGVGSGGGRVMLTLLQQMSELEPSHGLSRFWFMQHLMFCFSFQKLFIMQPDQCSEIL